MKTIKFTFNKIIYFLNNNLVKILAIFILASILLFSVTLLTSCGAVSDITQSATSTGNYDFLAQFAELRTQMEKLEKKFENSNESGIKMNEKVEDLKSKTEAINKTSNEVRSQNNDIKQMQDKMKDMQIKLEEMMKNFSNNVSTVPSAVTEIKKISGLFDITKQRGIIGEKQLEMILKSVLPENTYEIQPTLENNLRPDFIVKLGKQKFIIDAKFPMQNYQNIRLSNEENEKSKFITAFKKDVKTMIDGLCKYNDNVLMFFPSDNILADLNEFDPNMQNYAYSKKITLTSPSTIWLILQTLIHQNKMMEDYQKYSTVANEWQKFVATPFKTWVDRWCAIIKKWNQLTDSMRDLTTTSYKIVAGGEKINKDNDISSVLIETKELLDDTKTTLNKLETKEEA